jgi:hypothetical protein
LHDFSDKWNNVPAFVEVVNKFEKLTSEIDAQRQIQEGRTTGITENKQKEEDEMIQATIETGAAVYAYADIIGDSELKSKVNYSPSDLKTARDTDLRVICQSVHNVAKDRISELGDYGTTPEDLDKLQKEIDDFSEMLSKSMKAINTRSTATAKIAELMKETDELLKNQLDKLVTTLQSREPEFYTNYMKARRIIDMGSRSQSEEEQEQEPELDD